MAVGVRSSNHFLSYLLRDAATRTGLYTGLSLSLIFSAWLLIANGMQFREPMAVVRDVIAAGSLALVGCIPVLRFYRLPSDLLLSSMLGWGTFTLTYGSLSLNFEMPDQSYSTFQVFVLGAIIYFLLATLCWIGTVIWRVRAMHSSHPRH